VQDPKHIKREERRKLIRDSWEERYPDLVQGRVTLGEIMGYDDDRLMKLATKGTRLFKLGKIDAALKVFRGLVLLDPWVPYFHYLLGGAYEKLGRLDRALREYDSTLEMTSDAEPIPDIVPYAVLGKGRVLGRLGQASEAVQTLGPLAEGDLPSAEPSLAAAARLIRGHLQKSREAED
jgi:tetratricopeptide (TPR) repeat protein